MATRKTVRIDHAVIAAVGCLLLGYVLGIVTALLVQGSPAHTPGPVAQSAPAVSPPSAALGSTAAEIRELRNIVANDPDNYAAWVRLGNQYFDSDQFMEAIDAYTRALDIQDGDPNVITDRAIMYRRIGDFDRAVAELRRAAQADPRHLNSLLNLGVVLRYDKHDVEGAIRAWEAYLERNPPPEMAAKIRSEVETLKKQGR